MASTIRSRAIGRTRAGISFNEPPSYSKESGKRINGVTQSRKGASNIRPEVAAIEIPQEWAEGLSLTRLDRSAYFEEPNESAIVEVSAYLAAVVSDLRANIGEDSEVAALMRSRLEMDFYGDLAGKTAQRIAEQIGRQCGIVVRTKVKTLTKQDKPRTYRMDSTRKRRG